MIELDPFPCSWGEHFWSFPPLQIKHPVKSRLEGKHVTTLTLAVAAAKLFKGVNFPSCSGL